MRVSLPRWHWLIRLAVTGACAKRISDHCVRGGAQTPAGSSGRDRAGSRRFSRLAHLGSMGTTLRVLHVLSSMSSARGGPSVAVRNMMKALHLRGIDVDVATTDDDGDTRRSDVPVDRFVEVLGQR